MATSDSTDKLTISLEFFKDWNGYLLIVTVVAIGWAAGGGAAFAGHWVKFLCVGSFGISAILGIFTLALVPLVVEAMKPSSKSIFDVGASFNVFSRTVPLYTFKTFRLKWVCWPQSVFFILGIVFYVFGTSTP